MATKKPADKSKRSHSRPCDACAVRRVRCDIATVASGRCTNCTNHDIQCTNLRVRQKSGPKKIQKKTRESIAKILTTKVLTSPRAAAPATTTTAATSTTVYGRPFSLKQILPYLDIYQNWFYGIWPVISVPTSIAKLKRSDHIPTVQEALDMTRPDEEYDLVIGEENAQEYALICAQCAMIARYHNFLKSTDIAHTVENCPDASEYAQEARRIIFEYELKSNPNAEVLLTSFFLHKYHSNTLGEHQKGLIYLRESVSLAHILMLHDPETLILKHPLDAHRIKKIYYLLLVTERFISFETNLPVLLEPTIPIPDQDLEEYPDLLYGFIALCRIFSATDKQMYKELYDKVLKNERGANRSPGHEFDHDAMDVLNSHVPETNILQDFLQNHSNDLKKQWLFQMQEKLNRDIDQNLIASDAQVVNIMLSKAWLQSVGWLIASENYLINPNAQSPPLDDCFSVRFPLKIAQDFLECVKGLPDFAFESNGPDVSVKLLEIADSLHTFYIMSTDPDDSSLAYDQLATIYHMCLRYKANLDLPRALHAKISGLFEPKKEGTPHLPPPNQMHLLDEDVEELQVFEERQQQQKQQQQQQQMRRQSQDLFMSNRSSTSSSMSDGTTIHGHPESVSSVDEEHIMMGPQLPPSGFTPANTGLTNTGLTPVNTAMSPSGFVASVLTPTGGLLQKSPSSVVLSQMGASLSPFYIPGAMG